jgi:hypothetical protein
MPSSGTTHMGHTHAVKSRALGGPAVWPWTHTLTQTNPWRPLLGARG